MFRSSTGGILTLNQAPRRRFLNLEMSQRTIQELHPIIATSLKQNCEFARKAAKRGELPRSTEGDFILGARGELLQGEKLALRWTRARRVIKALSDFVFTLEDLRNGSTDEIHACVLRFYCDEALGTDAILPLVVFSESGMRVDRFTRIEDQDGKRFVHVRWRRLSHPEDKLEPLKRVYEDAPKLVSKLLARKSLSKSILRVPRKP